MDVSYLDSILIFIFTFNKIHPSHCEFWYVYRYTYIHIVISLCPHILHFTDLSCHRVSLVSYLCPLSVPMLHNIQNCDFFLKEVALNFTIIFFPQKGEKMLLCGCYLVEHVSRRYYIVWWNFFYGSMVYGNMRNLVWLWGLY